MSTPKPWEHAKSGEGSGTDPLAARFVESLSYDTRLYAADIRGSIAHAQMLDRVGMISRDDLAAIERGLREIQREIESAPAGPRAVGVRGAWPGWKIDLEDVHMCIEAALIEKIGEPGRRLHTGRSRNDQVALDLRLWLRDEAAPALHSALADLLDAFKDLARRCGPIVLPTYTHLQRAQPGTVGAECMAWWSMFARDANLCSQQETGEWGLMASPLGSGAVAGSLLPLDRHAAAQSLGFATPEQSSIDATASRDEALDFAYLLSRIAVHLSRLAEQWIIYCTTEFGFLKLGSAFTTGSSMMPQKRNPDMLELIRGRSANIIGALTGLLTLCKGLPLAYNRDLQEDKRLLFAAFDTTLDCIVMAARVVASAEFDQTRIDTAAGGLDRGYLDATALAEHLVLRGVPFRTAHQIVGSLVRECEATGRDALSQMKVDEFNAALHAAGFPKITIDRTVYDVLNAKNVAAAYKSAGHAGSGPGGYRDWLEADATHKELMEQAQASSERPGRDASTPAPAISAAAMQAAAPASLFGGEAEAVDPAARRNADAALIAAYQKVGRTLDDLPYTTDFDAMHSQLQGAGTGLTKRTALQRLQNLRKAGKLPPAGRAASTPPRISEDEETLLRELVIAMTGSLGQRDQLPYDPRFDGLVEAFNQQAGRELSPHDIWRLVAKLAK
ncbi:MAG: argininosuccinate lyase [Phycisphaeraceae bacterium]|nr:argininosuccinate lyase [Phycisphaeraceae bacterium]